MKKYILADLYRYFGKVSFGLFLRGLFIPGFRYMLLFRIVSCTHRANPLKWFFWLLLRIYRFNYGFQIPVGTKIGHGFYIGHFGTVIINPEAVIGNNCNISPGVTIGKTFRGNNQGVPTIHDNVWMGTNSVIVGDIIIEPNVMIAPNTFVNRSIPGNSVVVGNPMKVIEREDATSDYINNRIINSETY